MYRIQIIEMKFYIQVNKCKMLPHSSQMVRLCKRFLVKQFLYFHLFNQNLNLA